jgi:hypothetical protein
MKLPKGTKNHIKFHWIGNIINNKKYLLTADAASASAAAAVVAAAVAAVAVAAVHRPLLLLA